MPRQRPVPMRPSFEEICHGGFVGVLRRAQGTSRAQVTGQRKQHRWNGEATSLSFDADCVGAIAELLVAKYLGVSWTGIERGERDVRGAEVRWTAHDNGCLLLHDEDPAVPSVLVTGDLPELALRGWAFPNEVRLRDYWRTYEGKQPAYFVPQEVLRPMHALTDLLLQDRVTRRAAAKARATATPPGGPHGSEAAGAGA